MRRPAGTQSRAIAEAERSKSAYTVSLSLPNLGEVNFERSNFVVSREDVFVVQGHEQLPEMQREV
jgi:hypothetical protein